MEYLKFNDKQSAIDFCIKVNKGEGIYPDPKRITTGYTQPFDEGDNYYVVADSITLKYTDKKPVSLEKDDSAQPEISGYKVIKAIDYYDGNMSVWLKIDGIRTEIKINYNNPLNRSEVETKVLNKLSKL